MAILNAYPGLTTEITVNRAPLVEHNDEEAETSPTETTKYIEARSGSEFVIKTSLKEPFPATNGVEISVSVDGNRGPRWSVKPGPLFYKVPTKIKGVGLSQDGKRYFQNYQFAELNIVEEMEGHVDMNSLRKEVKLKGCIEVSYRWITNFTTRTKPTKSNNTERPSTPVDEGPSPPMPRRQLPMIGSIPEKALKGDTRSHQAILGEPRAKKAPSGSGSSYEYVDREPFGIIRFKYRSQAALKAMQVVADEAPESEIPEVGQRMKRSRSRRAAQSKQENDGDNTVKLEGGDLGRVKRERNASEDNEEVDGDDLAILETRSCKRPRKGQEVITLD
ncbi:hypothetical protein G6514_008301 [Epicoccum nigrum]|nr:hypothetical protein G6514_008301 [Epicoccum nigrum]